MATNKTMTCDCCGGNLPIQEVWDARRDTAGDCTGSVDGIGRCRAFDADDWRLSDMAEMLNRHGSAYAGNSVVDTAEDWIDHDFGVDDADEWCEIGVWDPATAGIFRDADLEPHEVRRAAQVLIEESDNPQKDYKDGSPIYAVCNNDLPADAIIDAASR